MQAIIAIEAVQHEYLANEWLISPCLQPERLRFPVLYSATVLPKIDPLVAPPNPEAEQYYFCAQLLFLQTLFSGDALPIQLVSGYWDNFFRLFGIDKPDELSDMPAHCTLVLDFEDVKEDDDINNRLYWQTVARRDPTIKHLKVNTHNWRSILTARMEQMPGFAGF